MNGNPQLLASRAKPSSSAMINIKGKTAGQRSSEHKVSWLTMLTATVAIIAQVGAKLWLGVDLGINIDLALATGFGGGAAYTLSRMVVKTGIAYAEGKVQAAKASAEVVKAKVVEPEPPQAEILPTTVIPPAKKPLAPQPGPFATIEPQLPGEETQVY